MSAFFFVFVFGDVSTPVDGLFLLSGVHKYTGNRRFFV
jgi:hypothetical protein